MPAFQPAEGQVDYTSIRYCPVIHCIVVHKNRLLMVKRSAALGTYPNHWSGVTGFLDTAASIEEKAQEEIEEELNLPKGAIASMKRGGMVIREDEQYGKTWIIFPVLVTVTSAAIQLNWESSSYRWLPLDEVKQLALLPGFTDILDALL